MSTPDFDGHTYDSERDHSRLATQLHAVRQAISDCQWWTLEALAKSTGAPEASISARLRDLRKPKFGGYMIKRAYRQRGQFVYRMLDPAGTQLKLIQ